MESSPYNQICTEINTQLFRRLERSSDVRHQFAPKGTSAAVLHNKNLKHWFRSLGDIDVDLTCTELIQRIHDRDLHNFLAIIIFANCSLEGAKRFVARLVAVDHWPVYHDEGKLLSDLPASIAQLEHLFHSDFVAYKFHSNQAFFCTVDIRRREEVRIEHPEIQRLPYLSEQPLAEGSFGKVFKVRIAKGHFFDPNSTTHANYNTEPLEVARKDYVVTEEFRAEDERDVMEKILNSTSRKCENILESFGSLNISGSTYSLFMPLAICDLRAYIMEHRTTKPSSLEAKAGFILCAVGLAEGLSFLHNDIKTSDLEDLVCYHMDLKPDNILIFRERGRYIWKLSDFGMARIKIRRRSGQNEEERNFNSWFVRRLKPSREPSVEGTLNRRGEGTYLAPESMSANAAMTASSDLWSLGCVLSVLFAYLEDGRDGVLLYSATRMKYKRADGYDRFFIATTTFMPNKLHPAVEKWHDNLIKSAKARSSREGQAISHALSGLEDYIFKVSPDGRKKARDVVKLLEETYKIAIRPEESMSPDGKSTDIKIRSFWRSTADRLRSDRSSRPGPSLTTHMQGWLLLELENDTYKGSQISADGALIVYWTDTKIVLYTSQSFSSSAPNRVVPAAQHTLQLQNCIWNSVSVAQDYLVASTTGSNFQCFIFDLEGGQNVGVSLDHFIRVSIPDVPEIQQVVLTPDAQNLVCTLRHWVDDRSPGSVFHARLSSLRKHYRGRSSPLPGEATQPPPGRITNIDWPASYVTNIVSSTEESLYMIVQPELDYRSQEHRVLVVRLSLRNEEFNELRIEAQGLDTSTTVSLFTTFVPFNRSRAVAIVSREKRLFIQQMPEDSLFPTAFGGPDMHNGRLLAPGTSASRDSSSRSDGFTAPSLARATTTMTTRPAPTVLEIQQDIKGYRILRLLMPNDDRKLYCIGTTTASHKLLLFSIDVPTTANDERSVKELAQLGDLSYSDEFTVRLAERPARRPSALHEASNGNADLILGEPSDGAYGTYLLVAALVSKNRRAIYRVPISGGSHSAQPHEQIGGQIIGNNHFERRLTVEGPPPAPGLGLIV